MSNPSPHGDSLRLLDIVDGWYHEHTRHHLVDVDPNAMENLIKPLLAHSLQERIDELKNWRARTLLTANDPLNIRVEMESRIKQLEAELTQHTSQEATNG